MSTPVKRHHRRLIRLAGLCLLLLAPTAPTIRAQAESAPPAGMPGKVVEPPQGTQAGTADPRQVEDRSRRLYDLMFASSDTPSFPGGSEEHLTALARSTATLSSDPESGRRRVNQLSSVCRPLMTLLQRYSPRTDRFAEREAKRELRQRVLICDLTSSMEFADRAGATRVGDYAIVREEPHSSFSGIKVKGTDLDILRVSLLADRLLLKEDLRPGYVFVPQLLYDVGGFLWANADYFLNPDPDAGIELAEGKDVEQAGREIMITITELMRQRAEEPNGHARVEKVLWDNRENFEKLAKED